MKIRNIILCVLGHIIAWGLIFVFMAPTFTRQVAFNEYWWHHCPSKRIRYYMSDSLLSYLEIHRPTYVETHQLLGEDFWDTWPDFKPDSLDRPRYLEYILRQDYDLYGSAWKMVIDFDDDGNYTDSHRWYDD